MSVIPTGAAIVRAFQSSRLAPNAVQTRTDRQVALLMLAEVVASDPTGNDGDHATTGAQAILVAQDFRAEAVSLWLDDLTVDAVKLARKAARA